jgi:hypothetical protein
MTWLLPPPTNNFCQFRDLTFLKLGRAEKQIMPTYSTLKNEQTRSGATCLVVHPKQNGETGTGLSHTASEASLVMRPAGITKQPGELLLKLLCETCRIKLYHLLQAGLQRLIKQSIRHFRCLVKYLLYFLYYCYVTKIYLL